MKKSTTIVCTILILFASKTKKCDNINLTCFTHYQVNQKKENLPLFNIYDKPNGKVIFNLPLDEESGWEIEILEKRFNYFKINNIWSKNFVESKGGPWANVWENDWMRRYDHVWVEKGSVGLNINNYDNQKVIIYNQPTSKSEIIGFIEKPQTVKILDVCRDWAYIEGINGNNKIYGWLEPKWQCSNPVTTCP